jgi:putative nucleotidyltransferase with HDIG domain
MKLQEILESDNLIEEIDNNMDYLLNIIPEIKDIIDFPHNHPHHHLDVWEHTKLALSMSENDFEVRLALLLHDVGKPYSYQDEEVRHFHGHAEVSSEMSKDILKRLNFQEKFINKISKLIQLHDTEITKEDIEKEYDFTLKRYEIQRCDAFAHHSKRLAKRKDYLEKIKKML